MGAEYNSLALGLQLHDDTLEQHPVHRVETSERLVENEYVRIVGNGNQELYYLPHPAAELANLLFFVNGHIHLPQEILGPCSG